MDEKTLTDEIAKIENELGNHERTGEAMALARAQGTIEELRSAYRRDPKVFGRHAQVLKDLAEKTKTRLLACQEELTRRFAEVNAELAQLERNRTALRTALVEVCRVNGEARVDLGQVRATRFLSLKLPPAASTARREVEQLLRDGGHYDAYAALSAAKLNSALAKNALPAPLTEKLRVLCEVTSSYRLQIVVENSGGSLEEMLGPDGGEG